MKYLVLSIALLVAVSTAAVAQVHFGIHGNVTNFNFGGDLDNIYGLGYGGGVHLDFKLPILLSFRLSGDYLMLSPDKGKYQTFLARFVGPAVASGITIDGGRIDVYSTNLNAKLDVLPLPVIHVYATGGVGYVRLSSTDAKLNFNGLPPVAVNAPVQTQSKPSVNAGAGVDLDLGPITLYGEVKVTWILTEGKTSTEVPLGTVGITF